MGCAQHGSNRYIANSRENRARFSKIFLAGSRAADWGGTADWGPCANGFDTETRGHRGTEKGTFGRSIATKNTGRRSRNKLKEPRIERIERIQAGNQPRITPMT